jgi:putative ABC transport system substrate-binding protein
MRRRTFLAGLGSATAWPLAARAGQGVPRIGFLGLAPADAEKPLFEAFEAGLSELGYVPGKTIEIEFRTADGLGEDRIAALARELVDLKVDVIVTGGPGVFVAHGVSNTVPIVAAAFGSIDQLVAMGIVASLGHPGGSVTGQTFLLDELFVKRIELLKQVKPAMASVGVLTLQGSSFNQFIPVLEAAVKALGLALEPIEIAGPDDCDRALSAGPGASIGGLMVTDLPQFTVGPGPAAIAAAAARHGLPAAGPAFFASNGGLLTYAVDIIPLFRRAAAFVDKILKGAKPGDIPIEQATKFVTIVNLKTAKALGIDIPPTVLAAADEVIE